MVYAALGAMIFIILFCFLKIYLMKKSAREIALSFTEKLHTDTNTQIDISSRDKDMRKLAAVINEQLYILRKAHLQYERGNMELKNAITNISHDLRTPLTAIRGYLDMMKRMEKSEKAERYLSIIAERAQLMEQLTEELFRYSIIISNDAPLQTEDIFINQVLAESISSFYPAFTEKGITPRISITEQKVVRRVNKADLLRIFSNLLNNAVKYSDGNPEISLNEGGIIIFANYAHELSSVQTNQLFDRFYTVETARNSTGLGLSIVRTLVEKMGGNITAEYDEKKLSIIISL